jgi:hypothetical protein
MKITKIPVAPVEQKLTLEVSAFELEVILHSLAHVHPTFSDPSPSLVAAQLFDEITDSGSVSFQYGRLRSEKNADGDIIIQVVDGCVAPADIWGKEK